MVRKLLLLGLIAISTRIASAAVYSPSAQELQFAYSADFIVDKPVKTHADAETWVRVHANHLFGVMVSPNLAKKMGVNSNLVGGIGSPRYPLSISIDEPKTDAKGWTHIVYRAQGYMVVYRPIAQQLLAHGEIQLPLPYDLPNYYDKHCTDPDFPDKEYFSYFFDPYKRGCSALISEPLAHQVTIRVRAVNGPTSLDAHLDQVRSGPVFKIYVVNGFDESISSKRDLGRQGYNQVRKYFLGHGFQEEVLRTDPRRPLSVYRGVIQGPAGRKNVEVHHLLVDTSSDSKGVTFAKFFGEAVENADVLVYSGHSGLSDYLDIPMLEKRSGGFHFNPNKKQIFYFEACETYAYYLTPFERAKPPGTLSIVTNGLESDFNTGDAVLSAFFDGMLEMQRPSVGWDQILGLMESRMNATNHSQGLTYLINVGDLL